MKLSYEGIGDLVVIPLLILLIVVAVFSWFIDTLKEQRIFGVFVSVELVAFVMLVHISSKSSMKEVSKAWLLIGCLTLGVLLSLTLFAGS